ncbi:MAG: hypothetical protein HFG56_05140 [Lachnospiraceae bacterium]|nr:hypothetical protein [Lachnospiraceae bacterium]MCI9282659.1 hypothetical protein [Lachnospiraceae bacterium]
MKRYMICLFLFIGVSAACLVAGYCINQENQNTSISSTEDKERETMATIQPTETVPENLAAVNRDQVHHEKLTGEYYLVSEDGFLLVFGKDKETICLYTHIPLMDFPTREQERLREGIWFPDMMDVIHYLESYTS